MTLAFLRLFSIGCLVALALCITSGCNKTSVNSEAKATILVWHDWPEPQSAALDELLRGFEDVYPHITVVVEYVATEDLREALFDQTAAGLGPDLIIESDMALIADLCDADLLVDLGQEDIKTDELLPHAIDALRIDRGLYGIPFAAHTNILYYNTKLIPEAPKSINDLRSLWSIEEIRISPAKDKVSNGNDPDGEKPDDKIPRNENSKSRKSKKVSGDARSQSKDGEKSSNSKGLAVPEKKSSKEEKQNEQKERQNDQTRTGAEKKSANEKESLRKAKERVVAQIGNFVGRHDGKQIALATDFFHAFWGIRAFGGEAFDERGELTIDDGFVGWLKWLLEIQNDPAVILNDNYKDLVDAFANGRTALMIGDSAEYVELQRKLGVENLGVATLPDGAKPAGGLLELEVISISKLTAQKKICCSVIRYLCNEISQRKIALSDVGQIPVNRNIKFDRRLMPVAATLNKQIQRTAIISLSNIRLQEEMFKIGNEIYLEVLAGEKQPDEAIDKLRKRLLNRKRQETNKGE